jgi:hypothetical protein
MLRTQCVSPQPNAGLGAPVTMPAELDLDARGRLLQATLAAVLMADESADSTAYRFIRRRDPSEADGQATQPPQGQTLAELRPIGGQRELGQPL